MLPGAVAVNVVAYVGYRLRGIPGVVVSVVAVIVPSFLLILLLAWLYARWGAIPSVASVFNGFLPAVCAVILATAWNLGRKAVAGWPQAILMFAATSALLARGGFLTTIAIVFTSGIVGLILFRKFGSVDPVTAPGPNSSASLKSLSPLPLVLAALLPASQLGSLFMVFASMSLMLFGGGYVFIPLIQQIVVDGYAWVSAREFVDAIAMGQVTPGPILISAAFIGYKVAGISGATAATIGIFAPSVVLMVACSTVFSRLQKSVLFQAALQGVRPAIVGLIIAAAVIIARTAPANFTSLAIFLIALLLLMRFRVPVAAVIVPAGAAGWLLYQVA